MTDCTLVLPAELEATLLDAAGLEIETGFVLLASIVRVGDSTRMLTRELHPVPEAGYLDRNATGLSVSPEGYLAALARAEDIGAAAIWVHTHPGAGSSPRASHKDDVVDLDLAETFRVRSGSPWYGSLVVGIDDTGRFTFTGQLTHEFGERLDIQSAWVVGDRLALIAAHGLDEPELHSMWDRNVRAFGGALQATLGRLRVSVVGCGGTGSSVVEQLARLGVRRFQLVDPDRLSESNLTRVYGSHPGDVGHPKVEVLANHLRRIAPDATVETVQGLITTQDVARAMTSADVIFGCTDDNAGRLVLCRLATYYLIPVIDCGVLLSSDRDQQLTGIDGRVTVMTPGNACLVCRDRIDLRRAAAELMAPGDRERLVGEGYAPALVGVEPAVVTYTTLVAAVAVAELIERFTGYGASPTPSEILVRCHDREMSTNIADPRPGHFCDPPAGMTGVGDTVPFLGQTWAR